MTSPPDWVWPLVIGSMLYMVWNTLAPLLQLMEAEDAKGEAEYGRDYPGEPEWVPLHEGQRQVAPDTSPRRGEDAWKKYRYYA